MFVVAIALASIWWLWSASRAEGFVYWAQFAAGSGTGTSIGRVDDDGLTGRNDAYIPGAGPSPCGVAVDNQYIYWVTWAPAGTPSIGRATLDGTVIEPNFIPTGGTNACGVTVDNNFIYWANTGAGATGTSIGRAPKAGGSPTTHFINGADAPCGVAVDSTYIYWANNGDGTIARSPKNGIGADQDWIPSSASFPCGVAVNSTHIYWANAFTASSIGRANIDGTSPNQNLVPSSPGACGVALDDTYVYWANSTDNALGRALLDGSSPEQHFLDGAAAPCGVARQAQVFPPDPPTPPTPPTPPINKFKVKAVKKKPRFGRATLVIKVPGIGVLDIAGKGVVKRKKRTLKAGKVKITLKTKGKLAKTLERKGLARAKLKLAFTPDDGTASDQRKRVTLLKSRKR